MNIGKINKLKVKRKTDLGYILESNNEEVFLHFNETNNKELEVGQEVKAFLYFDHKNRITATLVIPLLTLEEKAQLKVVEVNQKLGVFVNMGIQKDLLVSKDDLPLSLSYWPQVGDKIYVKMIIKNRLLGKPLSLTEIKEFANFNLNVGEQVEAYVVHRNENGLHCLSLNNSLVFVHHTQKRKNYRIGEKVLVTITRVYEQTLNGTLIKQKEEMLLVDSDEIINYFRKHKELPLTNHSSPEEIKRFFPMSKKAFKRAIGVLYKNNSIEFKENSIIYIGDNNE